MLNALDSNMRHLLGDYIPTWKPDSGQRWNTKKRKRKPSVDPSINLRALFRWTSIPEDGKRTKYHGRRFEDLYVNLLDLEDADTWHFVRPMGKGSFGAAALFEKMGYDGKVLDDVVVKTAEAKTELMVPINGGLSLEAAIMAQVYELDNKFLLALRQYKYLDSKPELRYYLEHCEHGDLTRLHLRYKAWRKRFPEYFLWHVFYCLAMAIGGEKSLETGPWRSLETDDFGMVREGAFLHHMLDNTFFGGKVECMDYARVCIADFGVSKILDKNDRENKAYLHNGGTPLWRVPECRADQQAMKLFVKPFLDKKKHYVSRSTRVGEHKLTPAVNVWPVGAMVWTLITGRDIRELDDVVYNIFERGFWRNEPHTISEIELPQYSTELLGLIRACLKLDPSARPQPAELRELARQGWERQCAIELEHHRQDPVGTETRLKVWYDKNEIQSQPLGDANYYLDKRFWNEFMENQIWLPADWGPLWPEGAPKEVQVPDEWPYHIIEGD